MIIVTLGLFGFGFASVFTFSDQRAQQVTGADAHKSSLVVTVLGLSNTAGRLILGIVGDVGLRTRYLIEALSLFVAGATSVLLILTTSYTMNIIYAVIHGFCLGL